MKPFARIALLAAGFLTTSAPAAAPAERFAFKGIALGSDIAALASNPKYECRTSSAPAADTLCGLRPREKETIAGAPVRSVFFFFYGGKLTSISLYLDERHFAQVIDALRGKYGETPVRSEPIRNLKGVHFENRTYVWSTAEDRLQAQRYAGRVDQSALRYSAEALIRSIEARRAEVAKDPRKDL